MLTLSHFIKIFNTSKIDIDVDDNFYNEYTLLSEEIDVMRAYSQTRNYLSKKEHSSEKFKLNFECPTLAKGWDKNKESSNLSFLLIKDDNYYLAIMNNDTKHKKEALTLQETTQTKDVYKKVNYKLLPGANKMLPKVFFAK